MAETEVPISQADKLQDRLGLQPYVVECLLNSNDVMTIIVFNRILDEIDLLRSELMG